jgi:hypothetical protein
VPEGARWPCFVAGNEESQYRCTERNQLVADQTVDDSIRLLASGSGIQIV